MNSLIETERINHTSQIRQSISRSWWRCNWHLNRDFKKALHTLFSSLIPTPMENITMEDEQLSITDKASVFNCLLQQGSSIHCTGKENFHTCIIQALTRNKLFQDNCLQILSLMHARGQDTACQLANKSNYWLKKNQKGSGNCEIPVVLKPPSGNLFSRIPVKRGSCQGAGRGGCVERAGSGLPSACSPPAGTAPLPVLAAAALPGEATDADPVLRSCGVLAEGTRRSKWQYTRAQFTSPLEPKPLRWF